MLLPGQDIYTRDQYWHVDALGHDLEVLRWETAASEVP